MANVTLGGKPYVISSLTGLEVLDFLEAAEQVKSSRDQLLVDYRVLAASLAPKHPEMTVDALLKMPRADIVKAMPLVWKVTNGTVEGDGKGEA